MIIKRQFPRLQELAPLLKFRKPVLSATKRRLAKAYTIADLRDIAKKRTPKAPFDYTDGAADDELSLQRARTAFTEVQFNPAILRDVSQVDSSVTVFGQSFALPFGIAPTGFTRMMHSDGELAGATAAAEARIPFTLSTMGTFSIDEVAAVSQPHGVNWFQLYMWKERARSLALMEKAKAAGVEVLQITVDVPVAGKRLRDNRNGMTIPPQLTFGTMLNALPRTAWWWNFFTTRGITFANLSAWKGTVAELLDQMFDPTISFDDLAWLMKEWDGPVIVKGVQTLDDAKRVTDLGAAGILLSNHGGRQLDRALVPFHLLPQVSAEVGKRTTVMLDTGIMHGADIVAALALGAKFTLVGRAYLYGLMAGGKPGVDKTIAILKEQIIRTMKLLGVSSLEELEPGHVTQLSSLRP